MGAYCAYAHACLPRAIPSMIDGLVESQRKIIHTVLSLRSSMKVSQLASKVASSTHYEHGETSLAGAIVKMAQSFIGSNNVPLLLPLGQFGSRLDGGNDAASPRYLFTQGQPYLRHFFSEKDVLQYKKVEGVQVEPECFYPLLPLALVNGTRGIAVGFSTHILPYSTKDILENIERILHGKELQPMTPYVEGYQGFISEDYVSQGKVRQIKKKVFEIVELPLYVSINKYKTWLHNSPDICKFEEHHPNEKQVCFRVTTTSDITNPLEILHLRRKHVKSFNLLDIHGKVCSFSSPLEYLQQWVPFKIRAIALRKKHELQRLLVGIQTLQQEIDFIQQVLVTSVHEISSFISAATSDLASLPLTSLTQQAATKRKQRMLEYITERNALQAFTPKDLYLQDLASFRDRKTRKRKR